MEGAGICRLADGDAAYLAYEQTVERIAAEVAQAYQQTVSRRKQIEQARLQIASAAAALPLNFEGIRGRELRAIEAQQAISALAEARGRYLQSVIAYNRAQFALLRAVGRSPEPRLTDGDVPNSVHPTRPTPVPLTGE